MAGKGEKLKSRTGMHREKSVRKPAVRSCLELIAVILAVSCLWVSWMNQKTGYCWDDLTSYGAANSSYSLWMPTEKGKLELKDVVKGRLLGNSFGEFIGNISRFFRQTMEGGYSSSDLYQAYQSYRTQEMTPYWIEKEDIYEYLTVQKGERLNILSIMECDWEDTHPPLYHIALNAVCSLFPGQMSKWFAFTVNLISLQAACGLVYLIMKELRKSHPTALLTVAVYGMSAGAISTAVYLRMYAMLTAMVLALVYLHLTLAGRGYRMNRRGSVRMICIWVLGYLTQYYFCIAAAALALVAVWNMLHRGLYRECRAYLGRIMLAAVIGLVLWPFGIKHMFLTGRGSEAVSNFADPVNVFLRLTGYLQVIVRQVMAGWWILLLVAGLLAVNRIFLRKGKEADGSIRVSGQANPLKGRRPEKNTAGENMPGENISEGTASDMRKAVWDSKIPAAMYLWTLVIFYILLVTVASPGAETRYIACIFPVVVIGIMCELDSAGRDGIGKRIPKRLRATGAVAGVLIYFMSTCIIGPEYVEKLSEREEAILQEYSDKACIYVEEIFCYQRHLMELTRYDRCLIVNWGRIGDALKQAELPEEAVLYVSTVLDGNEVTEWFLKNTDYRNVDLLLDRTEEYADTGIYYLSK